MALEDTLTQIESLVTRSEQKEFVEFELFPIVFEIINHPSVVSEVTIPRLKETFHRIAAMNKSTYHGCGFYDRLRESALPFSQEIFERAVFTEPYYNCQPDALSGYLVTTLRENGFVDAELFFYLTDNRNYRKYVNIPIKMETLSTHDQQQIKTSLIYSVQENRNSFMIEVGLKGALIFKLPELNHAIGEALRRDVLEMENLLTPRDTDGPDSPTPYDITSGMANTLYRLTGEERYNTVHQMLSNVARYVKGESHREKYSLVHEKVIGLLKD